MQTGGDFVVSQGSYQGPLSLLLKLIENNKLTIDQISLERVTGEYLKRIESLTVNEDEINSFLRVAAALILIKSQDLLPGEASQLDEDLPSEEQLAEQLRTYKRFADAAQTLGQKMTQPSYRSAKIIRSAALTVTKIDPQQLHAQLTQINVKLKKQKDLRQKPAVRLRSLPIMDQLKSLLATLAAQKKVVISDWLHVSIEPRTKIANFLALLEAVNSGKATIAQSGKEVRWTQP